MNVYRGDLGLEGARAPWELGLGVANAVRRSFFRLFVPMAFVLGLFTAHVQITQLGRTYLETVQLERHQAVLAGQAEDPWQYRVLSEVVTEGALRAAAAAHLARPVFRAFVALRTLGNTAIFLLLALYLRRLGLRRAETILGIGCLAWGMTLSNYDSDLQLNTCCDVILCLVAALAVLGERRWLLVPLAALAALNRETGVAVVLLPLGLDWARGLRGEKLRGAILIALVGAAAFVLVYAALRWGYGPRPLRTAYGHRPGLDLLLFNLRESDTWWSLVGLLGPLPLLAFTGARKRALPPAVTGFFWALAVPWLAVHFVAARVAEARLLLVPVVLVVLPAALFGLRAALAQPLPSEGARA